MRLGTCGEVIVGKIENGGNIGGCQRLYPQKMFMCEPGHAHPFSAGTGLAQAVGDVHKAFAGVAAVA